MKPEDKRRLHNSILHATIVQQDEPSEDNSSVYLIFERLNTGGMMLTPQEIRACIYHGVLNDLLGELNQYGPWRKIFGKLHTRMRDQELILRFFALYFEASNYQPPMKEFLNKYMAKNKGFNRQGRDLLIETFERTIITMYQGLGKAAFKPYGALNAAVFDSVMVGLARRLELGKISNIQQLKEKYYHLVKDPSYIAAIERSTARSENVKRRISAATAIFADVE